MNNEFPKMLYRFPGTEQFAEGNFATVVVVNEDEQAQAFKDGWFLSPPEAKAGASKPVDPWAKPEVVSE